MAIRTKVVLGPNGSETVLLTAAENAARDAEESAWLADATNREWSAIRTQRNALISATDWRVLPDQPVSQPWLDYRQALRDLPANTDDPSNPTWPTKPGA